jgi:SAM-dependent methyltransferase
MYQRNIKNLRSFHNKVKYNLIEYASMCDNSTLLDIGMGRGGDLLKWEKCKIQNVVGYDPDQNSIDDACKRYFNLNIDRNYTFYCCLNFTDLNLRESYFSIISCQFAIHYFFSDLKSIRDLLQNIKNKLKNKGLFIGTFMNASKINEYLVNDIYMNDAMMITKQNSSTDCIGEVIHVHLAGTLYFSENSISKEFMVYPHILSRECERIGLKLIKMTTFEEHCNNMKCTHMMDESHTICSFMYSSFIFQLL